MGIIDSIKDKISGIFEFFSTRKNKPKRLRIDRKKIDRLLYPDYSFDMPKDRHQKPVYRRFSPPMPKLKCQIRNYNEKPQKKKELSLKKMHMIATSIIYPILLLSYAAFFLLIEYRSDMVFHYQFSRTVHYGSKDDIPIMLAKLCSIHDGKDMQIKCVYDYYQQFFQYDAKDHFYPIEFILTNGSDCKNSALFYCSVLKDMGIECQPVFMEHHMYALASWDGGYCNLDQQFMDCQGME